MQEGSPLRRVLEQCCSDTAMGRSLVTEVSSPCIATSCEGYTLFGWLHDYERRVRNGPSLVGSSSYIPQPPDSPLPPSFQKPLRTGTESRRTSCNLSTGCQPRPYPSGALRPLGSGPLPQCIGKQELEELGGRLAKSAAPHVCSTCESPNPFECSSRYIRSGILLPASAALERRSALTVVGPSRSVGRAIVLQGTFSRPDLSVSLLWVRLPCRKH